MKNLKNIISLVLAAIIVLSMFAIVFLNPVMATTDANKNLITNGGFETGDITGFRMWEGNYVQVTNEKSHSGSYSLKYLTGGRPYIRYPVNVDTNTDYSWSFWVLDGNNGWNTYAFLADVYNEDESSALTSTISYPLDNHDDHNNKINDGKWIGTIPKWRKYVVHFNSGSNTTVFLRLFNNNSNAVGYLDDFALYKTKDSVIQDASFEDGSGYSKGSRMFAQLSEEEKFDGTKSLYIANKTNNGTDFKTYSIQNLVSVEKNTDYVWRFYVKGGLKDSANSKLTDTNGVALASGDSFGRVYVKSNTAYNSSVPTTQHYNLNENARALSVTLTSQNGDNYKSGNNTLKYKDDNWSYYEVTFNSGENSEVILQLGAAGANSLYTDAWSLEKVVGFDGGFETGKSVGFVISNTNAQVVTEEKHTGEYSLKIPKDGTSTIRHVAQVEKNTYYDFTFWVKTDCAQKEHYGALVYVLDSGYTGTGSGGASIVINEQSTEGGSFIDRSEKQKWVAFTNEWVKYTVRVNSGDNETITPVIDKLNTNSLFYLDDWSLTKVTDDYEPEDPAEFDGGFETGKSAGFVINNPNAQVVTEEKHTGEYSLKIPKDGTSTIRHVAQVEKNTYYDFTFWVKTDCTQKEHYGALVYVLDSGYTGSGSGGASIVINEQSSEGGSFVDRSEKQKWVAFTNEWVKYTLRVYSGENETITPVIDKLNTNSLFYLDDWSLTKVTDDYEPEDPAEFDGGFETGKSAGFIISNPNAQVVTEEKHTGEYSLKIPKDGTSTIRHVAQVEKNTYYDFTFWVKTDCAELDYYGALVYILDSGYTGSGNGGTSLAIVEQSTDKGSILNRSDYQKWAGFKNEWVKYTFKVYTGENETITPVIDKLNTNATFYLDDWALTKSTPPPKFDPGFESGSTVGFNFSDSQNAEIVTEEAHNGVYSLKVGYGKTTEFSRTIDVKPNTYYEFSYWAKTLNTGDYQILYWINGSDNKPIKILDFSTDSAGTIVYDREDSTQKWAGFSDNNWHQFRLVINSGENTSITTKIYKAAEKATIYFDDWYCDAMTSGITDENPENKYCEYYFNMIPNGNFEDDFTKADWLNIDGITRTKSSKEEAETVGKHYTTLKGIVSYRKEIPLKMGRTYTFGISYKQSATNNVKIGLIKQDGTELVVVGKTNSKMSSIISLNDTSGKWQRIAYTFLAPEDAKIIFTISGKADDIALDEINLFAVEYGYSENPNDYGVGYKPLIPDEVDAVPVIDDGISLDEDTSEDEDTSNTESENEIKEDDGKEDSGKKKAVILRKRRKKPNNNLKWLYWTIPIVMVVLISLSIIIIVFIKKKKGVAKK